MREFEDVGRLLCFWGNLKEHPKCPHGPTLLFGRENDNQIKKFFACSACRDRKLCRFYLEESKQLNKHQESIWEKEKKKFLSNYNHQKLFIKYNELMIENSAARIYCHTCQKLLHTSDKSWHAEHDLLENISDHLMSHPTELLKPLEDSKHEAQYFFSKKAVEDLIGILKSLGAKNVLCIGAPRIHEYIKNDQSDMSSLLLDLDGRFHNFFGPLEFCWYNLFNHHFFRNDSKDLFKEFMTQNGGKDTYVVCDPPFGGRVEPMSQTIKTIMDLHKKWNNLKEEEDQLKIFFIFPYYMESIMRAKSNPPEIEGGLKDFKMSDYKVSYENHPLFILKSDKQKLGSQIRIFTNVPLNLIKLPESDGYKYCKRCQKWVAQENKHCKLCKSCTSKDGRRYRHCKQCQRCVKDSWVHCKKCNRCALTIHKCGQRPNVGSCYKCNESGHTEKECESFQLKKAALIKKRKAKESDKKLKREKDHTEKLKTEKECESFQSKKAAVMKAKKRKAKESNDDEKPIKKNRTEKVKTVQQKGSKKSI